MSAAHPSPTTLRLLACVESFARHEDGAVGHDDWPGLVRVLENELALLTRLATENAAAPGRGSSLAERSAALKERYERLSARVADSLRRSREEYAGLGETAGRVRAIRKAYS